MVGWPLRRQWRYLDSDRVELGGPRMHAHAQKYKRVNVTSNLLANGSVVYSVHVSGPHFHYSYASLKHCTMSGEV